MKAVYWITLPLWIIPVIVIMILIAVVDCVYELLEAIDQRDY
jgi:hypothetical protein